MLLGDLGVITFEEDRFSSGGWIYYTPHGLLSSKARIWALETCAGAGGGRYDLLAKRWVCSRRSAGQSGFAAGIWSAYSLRWPPQDKSFSASQSGRFFVHLGKKRKVGGQDGKRVSHEGLIAVIDLERAFDEGPDA